MQRVLCLQVIAAVVLGVTAAAFSLDPAHQTSAATTSLYCETKYYCAYVEYYPDGSTRFIDNRWYKGGRGCAWDQFGNWSCGADRWRTVEWADDFKWWGDPIWYRDHSYVSYAWYYNEVMGDYWHCYCQDNSIYAETVRVSNFAQFYYVDDSGNDQYWHVPYDPNDPWMWYF